MTFKDSVHSAFKQCFRIAGRATRSEFWFYVLFCIIATAIISLTLSALFAALGSTLLLNFVVLGIAVTVVSAPSVALTIRRLHDVGKSGWWYVVIYIVLPLVGLAITSLAVISAISMIFSVIVLIAQGIGNMMILVFLLLDSYPADNRYGPNPKDTKY